MEKIIKLNILSFLRNIDKDYENNDISQNDIYKVNIVNNNNILNLKDNKKQLNQHFKNNNNIINNIEGYRNRNVIITQSERSNLKNKTQIFMENLINREQNKILSLYNNPIFFGIRALCQSLYLNKDEEIEEKNNNKKPLENIIEEKNEDINNNKNGIVIKVKKKKNNKKKKKKKKKEDIHIMENIKINDYKDN